MTKIEWCDLTINPITGCLNNCDFCYARRFAHRLAGRYGYPKDEPFQPTFHVDKLADIAGLIGKGKRVFLDSMSDWFSPGVNPDWIKQIIEMVEAVPRHTFLVLTKRPDRIWLDDIPENLWVGTSVTCQMDIHRIQELKTALPNYHKFISFEPLHGSIEADLTDIDWIIVGAETGNRKGKICPEAEWVENIKRVAEQGCIPVFLKNNLRSYCLPGEKYPQEFP